MPSQGPQQAPKTSSILRIAFLNLPSLESIADAALGLPTPVTRQAFLHASLLLAQRLQSDEDLSLSGPNHRPEHGWARSPCANHPHASFCSPTRRWVFSKTLRKGTCQALLAGRTCGCESPSRAPCVTTSEGRRPIAPGLSQAAAPGVHLP